MMTCDTMVRFVHEMYEVADKISKAEKVLNNHEKRKFVHVRPSRRATEKNRLLQ